MMALIEDPPSIEKILKHLHLCDPHPDPPRLGEAGRTTARSPSLTARYRTLPDYQGYPAGTF